jgi:O-methyltransferase/methyltransferase family protein
MNVTTSSVESPIPLAAQMHQLLTGFEVSQALFVVAELGVATALLDGPQRLADLAARVGANADALERLIRFLVPHGVFRTSGRDDIEITDLGGVLAERADDSMHGVARYLMRTHYAPFSDLLHTVRTGEVAATKYLGQPFFDWINATPGLAELQNSAMAQFTTGGRGDVLDRIRFPDGQTIADIGGADGSLLAEILPRLPGRRGIVFDMPRVVTAATATLAAAGLSDRTTVEGGDFFDAVPAADIYVLSAVLHDWDDASALRILLNIADATDQDAHLILVEIVVPEDDALHATNVDFTMMTMVGGRERTESQWRRLLADGGFLLNRITSGGGLYCAIEATRRRR